jgi:hypothetical protein
MARSENKVRRQGLLIASALLACSCNVYDESLLGGGLGGASIDGTGGASFGGNSASGGAGGERDASSAGNSGAGGIGGTANGSGGAAGSVGSGGSSATGGAAGAGGSTGAGSARGGGGTSTGSGGSTGRGGAGTGGSSAGTGGAGTGGSTAGTGGSGVRDSGSSDAQVPPAPPCLNGETKGGGCSTATPEGRSCYKTCGPDAVGYKLETCSSGLYAESDCAYLQDKDYSCYRLPLSPATPPACAAGTQGSMPCSIPACTPCGGTYLDSTGAQKSGYCVCSAANITWTCGSTSTNSWPCSATQPRANPGC